MVETSNECNIRTTTAETAKRVIENKTYQIYYRLGADASGNYSEALNHFYVTADGSDQGWIAANGFNYALSSLMKQDLAGTGFTVKSNAFIGSVTTSNSDDGKTQTCTQVINILDDQNQATGVTATVHWTQTCIN